MRHNNNNHGNHGNGHSNRRSNKGRSGGSNNNQGRRGSNVPPRMQVFDSNGPDVRIRGTAWQVHEKYLALAKDAASSGDSIMAENYMQHAEHYQRIINTFTEQMGNWAPPVSSTDQVIEADAEGDTQDDDVQDNGDEAVNAEAPRQQQGRRNNRDNYNRDGNRENSRENNREGGRDNNRARRTARPAVDTDDDLGLPSSLLKPSGVAPEKVAESA